MSKVVKNNVSEKEALLQEDKRKQFEDFVNTFGNTFDGRGGCVNYAKFIGYDKGAISRMMNGETPVHDIHFTIIRLVNEREEAKKKARQQTRQIKLLKMFDRLRGISLKRSSLRC